MHIQTRVNRCKKQHNILLAQFVTQTPRCLCPFLTYRNTPATASKKKPRLQRYQNLNHNTSCSDISYSRKPPEHFILSMTTNLPPLKDVEQLSPLVTRILGGNPGKVPYSPVLLFQCHSADGR